MEHQQHASTNVVSAHAVASSLAGAGPSFILIARREPDGLVYMGAQNDPKQWLTLLGSYGVQVAEYRIVTTRHAQRIVSSLRVTKFGPNAWGMEVTGPWLAAEYPQVLAALAEYDLDTGERIANDRVKLHDTVYVDGIGPGVVKGFTAGGRVEVVSTRYPRGTLITYAAPGRVSRVCA